jgi:6-phosphogluconolactonase
MDTPLKPPPGSLLARKGPVAALDARQQSPGRAAAVTLRFAGDCLGGCGRFALGLLLLPVVVCGADWIAYVGTYTRQDSKGIYAFAFQPTTGKLTARGLAAETSNPSFLAVAPNQHFVYAANENSPGTISAFAVDPGTARLKLLNAVSSRGAGPCHVAVDRTGKWIFAANYNTGSVAVFRVHADGTLGEASGFAQHSGSSVNPQRQESPHAHSVSVSPDNRFVLVADLGLDEVLLYRFDALKGTLTAHDPPFAKIAPGSGPRHMAFRPDGKFVYALNEMSATVTAFGYAAGNGGLGEIQTVPTLPAGFEGPNSSAEIAVHPDGRFLYTSNRGHDSISIFRIDAAKGTLTFLDRVATRGKTPRNFAIDPTGAFLFAANQDSGSLVEFRIDRATGRLTATGDVLEVPSPVAVVFVR